MKLFHQLSKEEQEVVIDYYVSFILDFMMSSEKNLDFSFLPTHDEISFEDEEIFEYLQDCFSSAREEFKNGNAELSNSIVMDDEVASDLVFDLAHVLSTQTHFTDENDKVLNMNLLVSLKNATDMVNAQNIEPEVPEAETAEKTVEEFMNAVNTKKIHDLN